MKKTLILISILSLASCTNYNSIDEIDTSSNILYCYKDYSNYEEYITIEYKDNIINYIGYSYIFNNDISNLIKELNYDNIKFIDKTLDVSFENININNYKTIKKDLIKTLNIKKDNFNYIEKNNVNYSLFMDYISDYSCE